MNWMGIICMVTGVAFAMPDQTKLAHITQDRIDLDLATGELWFNDESVGLDELPVRIGTSYSISFSVGVRSEIEKDHFITPTDIHFAVPSERSAQGPSTVSADDLLAVLEQINSANLSPELVRLNLFIPTQLKRNQYHQLELGSGEQVVLNGTAMSIAELSQRKLKGNPFVIDQRNASGLVDYRQLLSVLCAIGGNAEIAGLEFVDQDRLSIEAIISTAKPDGTRDVKSAPSVNVKPGTAAMIRVVTNGTGQRTYESWMDEFHQEDLANLGIRFSVRAQIIGENIRVTGVIILVKQKSREGLFLHNDTPVASYTCSKVVVPIDVVLPSGIETVEFPMAEIDSQKSFCRVRAVVVDKRGMTKAQRAKAREAARN